MNALTQIKHTQKASRQEIDLGISDKSSWHTRFKHSAYVYAGGLPFELTEGDILAVFSQYGDIVDIHLVRDKKTGKSKGFAFLAYEDQRSTVLAVDNLSGAKVTGRIIRVEHVDSYRRKRAEVEGDDNDMDVAAGGDRKQNIDTQNNDRSHIGTQKPASTTNNNDEPWAAGNSVFALLNEARMKEEAEKGGERGESKRRGSGTSSSDEDRRRERRRRRKERRHDGYRDKLEKGKKHKRRHDRTRSRSRERRKC